MATTAFAPSRARRRAVAPPMPPAAAVTTAILSFRRPAHASNDWFAPGIDSSSSLFRHFARHAAYLVGSHLNELRREWAVSWRRIGTSTNDLRFPQTSDLLVGPARGPEDRIGLFAQHRCAPRQAYGRITERSEEIEAPHPAEFRVLDFLKDPIVLRLWMIKKLLDGMDRRHRDFMHLGAGDEFRRCHRRDRGGQFVVQQRHVLKPAAGLGKPWVRQQIRAIQDGTDASELIILNDQPENMAIARFEHAIHVARYGSHHVRIYKGVVLHLFLRNEGRPGIKHLDDHLLPLAAVPLARPQSCKGRHYAGHGRDLVSYSISDRQWWPARTLNRHETSQSLNHHVVGRLILVRAVLSKSFDGEVNKRGILL